MMRVYLPVAFLLATVGLQASTITFTATSPTACGGQPCSGSAEFKIIDENDFEITLNNDLSSIVSAGQLVTDLGFTLTAASVAMTSSSGTLVSIDQNGVPTVGSTGSTGWAFAGNGVPNNWLLCVICSNGVTTGVQPAHGIIDIETLYSSANGSIAEKNKAPHNPFVESGATFTFTTSATLPLTGNPFSDVFLSFGTAPGNEVPAAGGGTITGVVPEPISLMLAGGGLIGVAMLKRRRRQ